MQALSGTRALMSMKRTACKQRCGGEVGVSVAVDARLDRASQARQGAVDGLVGDDGPRTHLGAEGRLDAHNGHAQHETSLLDVRSQVVLALTKRLVLYACTWT